MFDDLTRPFVAVEEEEQSTEMKRDHMHAEASGQEVIPKSVGWYSIFIRILPARVNSAKTERKKKKKRLHLQLTDVAENSSMPEHPCRSWFCGNVYFKLKKLYSFYD